MGDEPTFLNLTSNCSVREPVAPVATEALTASTRTGEFEEAVKDPPIETVPWEEVDLVVHVVETVDVVVPEGGLPNGEYTISPTAAMMSRTASAASLLTMGAHA